MKNITLLGLTSLCAFLGMTTANAALTITCPELSVNNFSNRSGEKLREREGLNAFTISEIQSSGGNYHRINIYVWVPVAGVGVFNILSGDQVKIDKPIQDIKLTGIRHIEAKIERIGPEDKPVCRYAFSFDGISRPHEVNLGIETDHPLYQCKKTENNALVCEEHK